MLYDDNDYILPWDNHQSDVTKDMEEEKCSLQQKRNEKKTFSITLKSQKKTNTKVTKFMNVYIFMFTNARQHK